MNGTEDGNAPTRCISRRVPLQLPSCSEEQFETSKMKRRQQSRLVDVQRFVLQLASLKSLLLTGFPPRARLNWSFWAKRIVTTVIEKAPPIGHFHFSAVAVSAFPSATPRTPPIPASFNHSRCASRSSSRSRLTVSAATQSWFHPITVLSDQTVIGTYRSCAHQSLSRVPPCLLTEEVIICPRLLQICRTSLQAIDTHNSSCSI